MYLSTYESIDKILLNRSSLLPKGPEQDSVFVNYRSMDGGETDRHRSVWEDISENVNNGCFWEEKWQLIFLCYFFSKGHVHVYISPALLRCN